MSITGLALRVLFLSWLAVVGTSVQAELDLPADWTTPTPPFELFEDVYWVGTQGLGAFLFTSDDGHVLIDVGMPESAGHVASSIRSLGFELTDVRYLLNTQAHFDHSGGLAELKALTGAEMLASAGDRYSLVEGVYEGSEHIEAFDFPPVAVDGLVRDGQVVRVGDIALTAHMTPGHSPGCTSWSFEARDGADRWRALLFCSASVAANRLAPDPQYEGIVDDFRDTFAKMRTMEVDVWLAPHAEQFDLERKRALIGEVPGPFVDPTEKDRHMAAFEAAFEEALARQLAEAD